MTSPAVGAATRRPVATAPGAPASVGAVTSAPPRPGVAQLHSRAPGSRHAAVHPCGRAIRLKGVAKAATCAPEGRVPGPGRTVPAPAAAAAAADAAAGTPAPAPSEASATPQLVLEVHQATTAGEFRAAASLRAVSFYSYPPGRSEFAARSHRQMKADAEWESLTAKVEGRDVAYRDLDVTCYLATVDDPYVDLANAKRQTSSASVTNADAEPPTSQLSPHQQLLATLRSGLDASAQLPAEPGDRGGPSDPRVSGPSGSRSRPRRLVLGSLDLNVGSTLPSEELIGRLPQSDPRHQRAYLSNVCVAPAARRMGVARALLQRVEEVAAQRGVEWLYVHVVADNTAAVALYCNTFGFQMEQSESEATARALQRPRRLLLAKRIPGPSGRGK